MGACACNFTPIVIDFPSLNNGTGGGGGAGYPAGTGGGGIGFSGNDGAFLAGGAPKTVGTTGALTGGGGGLGQSGGVGVFSTASPVSTGAAGGGGPAVIGNNKVTWLNTGKLFGALQ